MIKRILAVVTLSAATLFVCPVQAQEQPQFNPEQQAQVEQLQGMFQQIQNNMANQGIDPQAFFQQMQQQQQAGTLDQQAMQQMLINQGILTQDMVNQIYGTVRTLALSTIRTQLGSTDEEWAVLQPKLLRVVNAMADVDQNQVARISGRIFNQNQQGNSEMDLARTRLKAAVEDPNTSTEEFHKSLVYWRSVRARAKLELADAQNDLVRIVTLRQEGVLLGLGVL
jgi:hypothetical protein